MSRWNRAPLPPGEDERIETQVEKIYNALKEGPKYNVQLARIALGYDRCIRALRNSDTGPGLIIERQWIKKGLNRYTLRSKQEPMWIQGGEVTLCTGEKFKRAIIVNAPDRNTCRNRAQHGFAKVKLFNTVFIDPWLSPEAANDLLLKMQIQLDRKDSEPPPVRKRAKAKQ